MNARRPHNHLTSAVAFTLLHMVPRQLSYGSCVIHGFGFYLISVDVNTTLISNVSHGCHSGIVPTIFHFHSLYLILIYLVAYINDLLYRSCGVVYIAFSFIPLFCVSFFRATSISIKIY